MLDGGSPEIPDEHTAGAQRVQPIKIRKDALLGEPVLRMEKGGIAVGKYLSAGEKEKEGPPEMS